jgi:tRNA1Val (adenine37-N6)-methyltransferase
MSEFTLDSICRGELVLEQPRKGYRFNVDSVILADFVEKAVVPPPEEVVDLGSGCGVIGLLLARRWPRCRVTLIELQQELADVAHKNAERNALSPRVETLHADLRDLSLWQARTPDLLVSNPPFFKASSGSLSPCVQLSLAKHEVACTLGDLLFSCAACLAEGRLLALIYPAQRFDELRVGLANHGFWIRQMRRLYPSRDRPCSRVLLLAEKGAEGRGYEHPPLIVEENPGRYTEEMKRILGDS